MSAGAVVDGARAEANEGLVLLLLHGLLRSMSHGFYWPPRTWKQIRSPAAAPSAPGKVAGLVNGMALCAPVAVAGARGVAGTCCPVKPACKCPMTGAGREASRIAVVQEPPAMATLPTLNQQWNQPTGGDPGTNDLKIAC